VIRTNLIDDLTLMPLPPWWQSPWALAGFVLAAVVLFWLVARFARRLTPKAVGGPPPVPVPDLTPQFLQRLADLRSKRQQLSAYDLAIACSDILREFLEWRLSLGVTTQTTREFLEAAAAKAELSTEARGSLGRYLTFCDLVKFARHGATDAEQAHFLDAAEQFVKQSSGGAA
jgi:hypothetical protein